MSRGNFGNSNPFSGLSWSVIAAPASSSGSQKSRTSASGARIVLAGVQQFENLTSDGGGSNYNSSQQSQASVCLLSEHGAIHKTVECRSMSSSAGNLERHFYFVILLLDERMILSPDKFFVQFPSKYTGTPQ